MTCPKCKGVGRLTMSDGRDDWDETVCPVCRGGGEICYMCQMPAQMCRCEGGCCGGSNRCEGAE